MDMRLLLKRDIIRGVRDLWNSQYPKDDYRLSRGESAKDVRERLSGLDLETAMEADVDTAIGTKGWASNVCDECGVDHETLVRIGEEPDYEARWIDLCADCLSKASALVRSA